MKSHENLVVSNPNVIMVNPVISVTRITVEFILEKLAACESVEQISDAPIHDSRRR